jgi:hypothetical protein
MKIAHFWPTEINILQCIKPEAESDWDEVFLAIHQPMRLVKRAFKKGTADDGRPATENEFLREFLRGDIPTGTLLMPILGDSGIGKSHLVRWLDVQLKRLPDADRRHVIRIPKSSSLKTVLFHILEDLHGDQYDEIRRQLTTARDRLDEIEAEESIRAAMLTAIRRRYSDACENREDARSKGQQVEQLENEWILHGHPQRSLPALLSDPETSRLFMSGTDQRPGIISQLARHLTTDSQDDRPPRRLFEEADLEITADIVIDEASEAARRYIQSLDRFGGRERKTAVRLLNSIIDSALQPLASPTDTSLSEIFLQIRRQLLADERELVLLVEDFAVLSGIQGALLDAMIREGVRGGVDACVMRTALAVTAGYDFGRYDTVKTRAVYGWYVDESPVDDDDQMVERICDYVGAYLNAARFGAEALKQRRSAFNDEEWPPHFGDDAELDAEDRRRLAAFGNSRSGWPLFPFNKAAIRQLSDIHLRDAADNRLRLNPRMMINHLLIRILRDYRSAWINGTFPTSDFLGDHAHDLSAVLQSELRNAESNVGTRSRYLALLRYWGDRPERLAEVALPQDVYEAFGLRALITSPSGPLGASSFRERQTEVMPHEGVTFGGRQGSAESSINQNVGPEPLPIPAPPPVPMITSEQPAEIRRWDRLLNGWNPSSTLPQKESNELRLMLANHVLGAIDWDVVFLRNLTTPEMRGWHGNIFLPNAKGTGNVSPANAMCVVCTNEEFSSLDQRNTAVLALLALVRHDHYKNWNYPDAELDYARLQNLLDRLVPQAVEWIQSKKYREFAGDPVQALVEHILLAARFLDVRKSHAPDFESLLDALFERAPDLPNSETTDEWTEFKIETVKHHQLLQEELLARTAVRQGGEKKAYGLDVVRLLTALRKSKGSSRSDVQLPEYTGSAEIRSAVTFARRFVPRLSEVVKNQQKRLAGIRRQCLTELGEDFDKAALITTLKEHVFPEAQRLGVLSSDLPRASDLQKLCEEFRLARVAETLKKLVAAESEDFAAQLSSLAQIDNHVLSVIEQFVSMMTRTLGALEKKIFAELTAGEGLLEGSKEGIEHTLMQMSEQLAVIGGSAS